MSTSPSPSTYSPPTFTAQDRAQLRGAAAQLVGRLGLTGYDNASVERADAWVDGPEFREAFGRGDASLAYDLGAYLGEVIIRRHGGSWSAGPSGPIVLIKRSGTQMIDPFGKVRKRAQNGIEDHLLSLVNLVAHVTERPRPDDVRMAARAALRSTAPVEEGGLRGWPLLAIVGLTLIVFPIAVLVGLLFVIDATYALIGGGLALPVGAALLMAIARAAGGKSASGVGFPPGTLAFEAALTLPLLEARLLEKMDSLGEHPSTSALEELQFYTKQAALVRDIVEHKDLRPGRGYVGFDTFGSASNSWQAARDAN
jgi:hypothetical protein